MFTDKELDRRNDEHEAKHEGQTPWGKCAHCNAQLYDDTAESDPCPVCGRS